MTERDIMGHEVTEALDNCLLIEDYPDDKYGPSCLACGRIEVGRELHVQCTYPKAGRFKVITVYEPDWRWWTADGRRRVRRK